MNKTTMINLIDEFKTFLFSKQEPEQAVEEPVKLEEEPVEDEQVDEYVLDDNTVVKIDKDCNISGVQVDPGTKLFTIDGNVITIGADGKVESVKDAEIPEGEEPVEAPVDMKEEPVEEPVEDDGKDKLIEDLLAQIDELQKEIDELKKSNEGKDAELLSKQDEITNLKSQIPTVVAGIEIKKSETPAEDKKMSLNELLKNNFK